jgi:hypothetical protein
MFSQTRNGFATPRVIFIIALIGSAGGASAQQNPQPTVMSRQRCASNEAVGWLGISGFTCTNCVLSAPGHGEPALFSTEPRVLSVGQGSPAEDEIRPGDVLVSIDGMLITTHAGGVRFNNLKPGDNATVEVRRNGELLRFRLEDLPAICRTDPRLPGSNLRPGEYANAARVGVGARAGGMGGRVATTAPMPRSPTPPPGAPDQPTRMIPRTRSLFTMPRATFGFGITCSTCSSHVDPDGSMTWDFERPPEVYSVETNSEAYRAGIRRDDVILSIDGHDITTPEGGRRFGAVEPGQRVMFRLRRGSAVLNRTVVAQRPARPDLAVVARQSETSLQQARELIEQLQRQAQVETTQLERLRRAQGGGEELRTLTESLRRQQEEQNAQLRALQSELSRADRQLQASIATTRPPEAAVRVDPRTNEVIAIPGSRPVRYVGRIGDTDIEIRGTPALVSENSDEIVIRIGDTEIRLKKVVRR